MKRKGIKRPAKPKDLVPVSGNSLSITTLEPLEPFVDALPLIPGAPRRDLEFSFHQQRRCLDVVTQRNKDLEAALKISLQERLEMLLYFQFRLETGEDESRERLKYRVLRLKAGIEKQAPLLDELFNQNDDMPPALARLILEAERKRKARKNG